MKYSMIAAFAVGASASIWQSEKPADSYPTYGGSPSNGSYVTEVLTAYTTYCPEATQITHGGQTYTVTEATTLTITNCPCTVTYPATTSTTSVCSTCSEAESTSEAPVYSSSTSEAPVYTTPPAVTPPVSGVPTSYAGNATVPTYSSPSATSAGPVSTFTGAAAKVAGQAGAGIAALFGVVAFVL